MAGDAPSTGGSISLITGASQNNDGASGVLNVASAGGIASSGNAVLQTGASTSGQSGWLLLSSGSTTRGTVGAISVSAGSAEN